jgi:hypothetical protein
MTALFRNLRLSLPMTTILAALPFSVSAASDAEVIAFCKPLLAETEQAIVDGGEPSLNRLFEATEFRDRDRETTVWSISVGSVERDVFLDNVLFPELRGVPGYAGLADANGENLMLPLVVAFEDDGLDYGFTYATWPDGTGGLTEWTGYAQRVQAGGETIESVCWVADDTL